MTKPEIKRGSMVHVFGGTWRVDWRDGAWISISNDNNEHNMVSVNVVELIDDTDIFKEIPEN